ncbi:MAG: YhcH/YjgK/YiaL family protein [Bacteroidota bacterium]|nr:YhcH/YjgK/YiaL family protein [Bacteroidota bacterium]
MIIDQLENASLYYGIGERFAKGLEYLKNTDFSKVEAGKYEIDGKNVFASVSEYDSKQPDAAKWEAHENYADIQFLVSGKEKMGYAPLETTTVKEAYNAEKDIVILNASGDYVTATPGTFIIFFPKDAHAPCIAIGKSAPVKKVVIKVKVA